MKTLLLVSYLPTLLPFLLSTELNKTKCSKLPFEKVLLINKLYVSKVLCREHSIYASNRDILGDADGL